MSEDWKCAAKETWELDKSTSWDGDAAAEDLFRHFSSDDENIDGPACRQAFLYYDADSDGTEKSNYKGPFCVVRNGGVMASLGACTKGKGRAAQADVPEDVKKKAVAVLDHYAGDHAGDGEGDDKKEEAGVPEMIFLSLVNHLAPEDLDVPGRRRRYTVATDDADVSKQVIDPLGLQWDVFATNAPMLLNHDPNLLFGGWEDWQTTVDQATGKVKTRAWAKFSTTKLGEELWTLAKEDFLRGTSLGVLVLEKDPDKTYPGATQPTVSKASVREISLTPLPKNSGVTMNSLPLEFVTKALELGVRVSTVRDMLPGSEPYFRDPPPAAKAGVAEALFTASAARFRGAAESVANHLAHLHSQIPDGLLDKRCLLSASLQNEDMAKGLAAVRRIGELTGKALVPEEETAPAAGHPQEKCDKCGAGFGLDGKCDKCDGTGKCLKCGGVVTAGECAKCGGLDIPPPTSEDLDRKSSSQPHAAETPDSGAQKEAAGAPSAELPESVTRMLAVADAQLALGRERLRQRQVAREAHEAKVDSLIGR